jgi:hypothetical protein
MAVLMFNRIKAAFSQFGFNTLAMPRSTDTL